MILGPLSSPGCMGRIMVEFLKYGLPGLAALLTLVVAGKFQMDFKNRSPTKSDRQVLYALMIFAFASLVSAGLLAMYEGYFIQTDKRLTEIRNEVSGLDMGLATKLSLESGSLANLPPAVKQQLEPLIFSMCDSMKNIAKSAEYSGILRCKSFN
jgi:hypothetical protein